MKLFASIFTVGIVFSSFAYGRMIYEDFQGYDVNTKAGEYIYYTDSSQNRAYNPWILATAEPGIQAAMGTIKEKDSGSLALFTPGNWIYFETENLTDTASLARWFQVHLGFMVNPEIAEANDKSLIAEVWYYAYADNDERFFESKATGVVDDGSPLQAYPRIYFEDAVWDKYDPKNFDEDGNYESVEKGIKVDDEFLEKLTAVGIQIRTNDFIIPEGFSEGDYYFDVWVDNFFVVPEPTMLMLLLTGCSLVFLSRGRRGAR